MVSRVSLADMLLELLCSMVQKVPGPAGFSGLLSIGVREDTTTDWVRITCGADTSIERNVTDPEAADAALLIGPAGARWFTSKQVGSIDDIQVFGDRDLIAAFVDRYLKHRSFVGVLAERK